MSTTTVAPRRTKVAALGKGRGSIWQRPDGAFYFIYMLDGRQYEVRLAATTKTEALREATERNAKRDRGRHIEPSRRSFEDVWNEYIAVKRAALDEGRGSRRTIELYEQRYATHLKPALGSLQFQKITVGHLSAFLNELRKKPGQAKRGQSKPMASSTRSGILRLASAILAFGVRRGYRADNPCQYLEPEERPDIAPATKGRALTDEECSRLITTTRPGLRSFVAFLAYTGVRMSEGLGARWEDLNLDAGTFTVKAQLERRREGEELSLKRTKSRNSEDRVIDLHPALVDLLKEHRKQSLSKGLHRPAAFIFCTADGSPHGHRNTARDISEAADRAGLNGEGLRPVSAHMLRHTFASRLIALGLDVVEVARQLGDRPETMMRVYAQAFTDARRREEVRDRIFAGTSIAL
jgi:integrase